VLPDLLGKKVSGEKFSGRAKVLKELVTHHADEEEKEMFPRAKKLFTKEESIALGDQMAACRKPMIAELKATSATTTAKLPKAKTV
jgi:hemerythrin superfamily protein